MTATRSSVRRTVVALTVGSFSVAALLGVVALLGGDFGDSQWRVLATTLVVGCTSSAVLCYLAVVETTYADLALLGGAAALVASGLALGMVWGDVESGPGERTVQAFGVATVVAVTLAQVCLLVGLAARRERLAALLWGTVVVAGVTAIVVSAMIVSEDVGGEDGLRLLGVVAILDVLGTVVTMALAVFGSDRRAVVPTPSAIVLPAGLTERVEQVAAASGTSPDHLVAIAVTRYLQALGASRS